MLEEYLPHIDRVSAKYRSVQV